MSYFSLSSETIFIKLSNIPNPINMKPINRVVYETALLTSKCIITDEISVNNNPMKAVLLLFLNIKT